MKATEDYGKYLTGIVMTERLMNKYGDAIDFKETETEYIFEILGYDNKIVIDKTSPFLKMWLLKILNKINKVGK